MVYAFSFFSLSRSLALWSACRFSLVTWSCSRFFHVPGTKKSHTETYLFTGFSLNGDTASQFRWSALEEREECCWCLVNLTRKAGWLKAHVFHKCLLICVNFRWDICAGVTGMLIAVRLQGHQSNTHDYLFTVHSLLTLWPIQYDKKKRVEVRYTSVSLQFPSWLTAVNVLFVVSDVQYWCSARGIGVTIY